MMTSSTAVRAAFIACISLLVNSEATPIEDLHFNSPLPREAPNNCSETSCMPPACKCASTDSPAGLSLSELPMFVLLTFDDPMPANNVAFMEELTSHLNPNGCNMSMSFYNPQMWTDHQQVNHLHRLGHEIAVHSVTHDDLTYASRELWESEILDMKTMLNLYANIPLDDIRGFRAPFLGIGGSLMYEVLKDNNFLYDCSWPSLLYTPWYSSDGGAPLGALWPYTLDYLSPQEQNVGVKPTDSVPGMWLHGMAHLEDNTGSYCAMLDDCHSATDELDTSADAVFEFFKRNFDYHYYSTKTPLGLYSHHPWFTFDDDNGVDVRRRGMIMFMEYLSTLPDVYMVSVDKLVKWAMDPVPLSEMDSFEPLRCMGELPPDTCGSEVQTTCYYNQNLPNDTPEIWVNICKPDCPLNYPYLGNPYGN